ncbi:hypothetical protein APF79_14085 [bacterium BRH_c32]|nr:MAG: hypothetical protein APF79_14085 [bacterium BRH_c32]
MDVMLDILEDGPELSLSINEMKNYLQYRAIKKISTKPENIKLDFESNKVFITIYNEGSLEYYPVRKSFVMKLFRWFHFPSSQFRYLNRETLVSVLNDYLINIKSIQVTVHLENLNAITITSKNFIEISDNSLIRILEKYKVSSIEKNDYFTRFYIETEKEIFTIGGDNFSYGINIINSETGFHSLAVYSYIRGYSCSNGALIKNKRDTNRITHYGPRKLTFSEELVRAIETEKENLNLISTSLSNLSKTKIRNIKDEKYRLGKVTGVKVSNEIFRNLSERSTLYECFKEIISFSNESGARRKLFLEEYAGHFLN